MKTKRAKLTKDERDVLILVARGMTNQQIAEQLKISTVKIKTLIHQACTKLKAHNRIQAVFFALKHKIINIRDIFTLEELVELMASLSPDTVEKIAYFIRQKPGLRKIPPDSEQALHEAIEQDTILTKREKDVLALVAHGLTNQEIADRLCTSTSTVRTFLYKACTKLEARSRAQAFISAVKKGAVSIDEVFPLHELVELLASLGPEAMETIARLLRQKLEQERLIKA
ncbi:MAG: response regulator transcription factor [Chloroflexi bacterium]|nr:response regulator transcription factor [Chloroflexota bacterium]